MKGFIDRLDRVQRILAGVCIALLSILISLDIFGRELFSHGFHWAQKTSVYLMIWAGFLGSSLTNNKGAHLRPEIADRLWPESLKGVFHRLRHFVSSVFCLGATYFSMEYVIESREFGDSNPMLGGFPLWIVQLVIPITFLLMGLTSLIFSINDKIAPNNKRELH
jgi:TRAP-type C4-dicarboxylate transport system permease small subunit